MMTTQRLTTTQPNTFTPAELRGLRAMRTRYRRDHDLTAREQAQLRFLRWLYQKGHLDG